jgi:hypothetical protein
MWPGARTAERFSAVVVMPTRHGSDSAMRANRTVGFVPTTTQGGQMFEAKGWHWVKRYTINPLRVTFTGFAASNF